MSWQISGGRVQRSHPDDGRHHAKVVDRVIAAKVSKKQQESKNARGEGKAKPAKVGGGRAGKKASKKKGR